MEVSTVVPTRRPVLLGQPHVDHDPFRRFTPTCSASDKAAIRASTRSRAISERIIESSCGSELERDAVRGSEPVNQAHEVLREIYDLVLHGNGVRGVENFSNSHAAENVVREMIP
jgi:hypothetical protein